MRPLHVQSGDEQSFMAVICAFLDKNARINKDSVGNAAKTIKILVDTVS